MALPRVASRVMLVVGLVVVPAAVLVVAGGCAENQRRHPIVSGWVFDLRDPRLVAGYADAVVVAEIVAEEDRSDATPETLFTVKVLEKLKGTPPETVGVRQTGARRCDGIHEFSDQPLLVVGGFYILNLKREDGPEMRLSGGPISASRVDDPRARAEAVASWREHVRNQRDPGLP